MAAGNVAFFALAIVAVAIGTLDNIVIFVMSNKERHFEATHCKNLLDFEFDKCVSVET